MMEVAPCPYLTPSSQSDASTLARFFPMHRQGSRENSVDAVVAQASSRSISTIMTRNNSSMTIGVGVSLQSCVAIIGPNYVRRTL